MCEYRNIFSFRDKKHCACNYFSFCVGENPLADDQSNHDINSVAGVLKLYFRGLENPLFPKERFNDLISCISKWIFFLVFSHQNCFTNGFPGKAAALLHFSSPNHYPITTRFLRPFVFFLDST